MTTFSLTSANIETELMGPYGVDAGEVAVALPEGRHPVEAEDVAEALVLAVVKLSASHV